MFIMKKTFKLSKLKIIFATREIADFVFNLILKEKVDEISLKNIQVVSRSFLDELYLLSQKKHIKIINIPEEILPLYKVIVRSHKNDKLYAPTIKVHLSNKIFA